MGNDGGKKCTCGHFRNEHLWIQKSVSKLAFLGEGFFRTPQEGRGLCKKCTCPKYDQSRFDKDAFIKYPERVIKNDDPEKRCTRCGRLLSNHVDVGHSFQGDKTVKD